MGDDDRNIRQIQRRRRDIEDRSCSLSGANSDAVEANAEKNNEPDCIYRSVRVFVDLGPDTKGGVSFI
jgi:hypothetical protein